MMIRLFILTIVAVLYVLPAHAISLVRDAETESLLREYSDPLIRAANLDPSTVRIFIVNDPSINAFVAGGANLFIHTGLIMASENPDMLKGVIAHEVGHIAGGHLARGAEAIEDAQLSTILSYVLGAAAGLAGGGEVAAGVLSAGQHVTQRNLMSFSRVNEQAADQAALQYLSATETPATGLLELMEKLRAKEQLYRTQIDPYALTHPLSKERIAHIRSHLLQQSKTANHASANAAQIERHKRVLAKLKGFINDPQLTLNNTEDNSIANKIARIVAYHRQSKGKQALVEITNLIEQEPNNPYLIELKGQILSESGRPEAALGYYKQASSMLPKSALLRTDYARMLIAQQTPDYPSAIQNLTQASQQDNTNPMTWQLLGQAEAEMGRDGKAALAYAEASLLRDEAELARRYAKEALDKLPKGSPAMLRAQDAREEAIRLQKKKKEKAS